MGFFDIIIAGLLLKGTVLLLDKYGFLGHDFYNVNTIKLSDAWDKLKEVAGYTLEQFTITYPFFESPCLCMMWIISALALITIFCRLPKKRWWLNCLMSLVAIAGLLFATQLAIFISENQIKLQFMFRLTGFFSLYFVFALMLAILWLFWRKMFLRNILFVLMVLITGLFIQRDMYAMRVWKQGLDAENKIYDRIMARIEEQPDFSYDKKYN